jgi:hypothetical protein
VNTDETHLHLALTGYTVGNWIKEVRSRLQHKKSFGAALRNELKVKASKLSDLLIKHGFPFVDILKIDAELAELEILCDLIQTGWLHRTGAIRIEWHGEEMLDDMYKILPDTHIWTAEKCSTDIGFMFGYTWDERYRTVTNSTKESAGDCNVGCS